MAAQINGLVAALHPPPPLSWILARKVREARGGGRGRRDEKRES